MSAPPSTGINAERKGYGRGLILGLTMAETMLLLVFCLLLVAGTIIVRKEIEAEQAREGLLAAESELERLNRRDEGSAGHWVPEDEWREIVRARSSIDALFRAGLTVEDAIELAPLKEHLGAPIIPPDEAREFIRARERIERSGITLEEAADFAPATFVLKKAWIDAAIDDPESEMRKLLRRAEISEGDVDPHDFPPIITLDEVRGYSFDTGSAELSDAFRDRLPEVLLRILEIADARGDIEIIEVIGHTDERAMPSAFSNLDREIKPVLDGELPVGTLRPADNAGLGLARALSVAQSLAAMPEMDAYTILPMSGGQLILPGDILTDGDRISDDPSRRRIEIRMRRRDSPH